MHAAWGALRNPAYTPALSLSASFGVALWRLAQSEAATVSDTDKEVFFTDQSHGHVPAPFWALQRGMRACTPLLLLLLVLGLVARGSEARMRRLHVDANVRVQGLMFRV